MLIFAIGCSSQPVTPDSSESTEAELPKAVPPAGQTTVYNTPANLETRKAPEKEPLEEIAPPKASCETPLGRIPDGGKATGYLQATVPADEVCISDTISCRDGKWTGDAVHPTCKVLKESSK